MNVTFAKLLLAMIIAITASISHAQNYGNYVGTVQTEWLPDGRTMRLLAPLIYFDPKGVEWRAPTNWEVNGASIPRFIWSFSGGPFEGKYRNASVIHDVACDQKMRSWEDVHEVFYWAMRASGVESWRAKVMYGAVYHFGPRWQRVISLRGLPQDQRENELDKARDQADRDSTAKIVEFQLCCTPADVEYAIEVTPSPPKLTEENFETLKQRIEESESMAAGALTLEDIRTFQPKM